MAESPAERTCWAKQEVHLKHYLCPRSSLSLRHPLLPPQASQTQGGAALALPHDLHDLHLAEESKNLTAALSAKEEQVGRCGILSVDLSPECGPTTCVYLFSQGVMPIRTRGRSIVV